MSTTGDGTRKQGEVEISKFPISLRDGLVIDVSFVCEFKGSSRAPGGWDNGVRHSNGVLQDRANIKNNKYNDVYGLAGNRFSPNASHSVTRYCCHRVPCLNCRWQMKSHTLAAARRGNKQGI